jgi:hypothetical protein
MNATLIEPFYLFIYFKTNQLFSCTKFPVKKRKNVGKILEIMRNHCYYFFPNNILKSEYFRVLKNS